MVDLSTALQKQLVALSVGSCTCGVKSPDAQWHDAHCRYRLIEEIRENVEALEQERAEQWRLRRDAEGSRDVARAACASMRIERDALKQRFVDAGLNTLGDIERAQSSGERPTGHVSIAHDGFAGDIIGHYETREGKRGVVVQQDGTRVVHVYGEKWLLPSAPATGGGE